jgi:ferredoxin
MNIVYISLGIVFLLSIFSTLHKKKKAREKVVHVVEINCVGCQRCLKRCRHNVLAVKRNENGTRVFVKHPDRCTACGDCFGGCKYDALKLVERINSVERISNNNIKLNKYENAYL